MWRGPREASGQRLVLAANALLGLAALAALALVALVHVADNYHVDHVAGAWMALAAYANDGTLYPPVYDDGVFGGTRYMPLGIVLNALAAQVSGEYVVSGKLLALLTVAALLAIVYVVARRLACERAMALGAVGAVIATFTALFAATSVYGDAPAVALQLAAVALVARDASPRSASGAGVLAALAVAAKLTALWGGASVLIWLLVRHRRLLPAYLAAAAATAIAVLLGVELVSHGRFSDNALQLGGAEGVQGLLAEVPRKLWALLLDFAPGTLLLAPVALAAVAVAAARRRLEIVDVALLLAVLVTVVVMADVGTGFNHLLDLAVLVPLSVAAAYGRSEAAPLRIALAAALAAATAVSLADVRHDVREAAVVAVERSTPDRLRTPALRVPVAAPILSEDPAILVQRGERPVVLDSYMLLRVLRRDPDRRRELIARLARHEFATVVLIMDLDLDDPWWSESHFGIEVARAIDRHYRLDRKVPGPVFMYRLHVPAE
ncbi:MAG TPA: hypothetical protein VGV67_07080 [Solirubrobacteraceae bacterium]|nr:hypothetical protein [Solirubrobacteraceae bacterium]